MGSGWYANIRRWFGRGTDSGRPVKRHQRCVGRRLERLEGRTVFAAGFSGALAIETDDLNSSIATDVQIDLVGNSYLTGRFSGTVDFDPGVGVTNLTARGSNDVFVAKYAPDRSLVWAQQLGGEGVSSWAEISNGLALSPNGDVYVTGQFPQAFQAGSTTLVSAGENDAFLVKLTSTGSVAWATRWGTAEHDVGWSVDVDGAGNVYAGSNSSVTTVRKYKPDGGLIWSKSVDINPAFVGLSSIDLDADTAGNVFVTGGFFGTVDFDPSSRTKWVSAGPSAPNNPSGASFVLKLDTNGSFKWVTPFVGVAANGVNGWATGRQVSVDPTGNVYTAGNYGATVDFDPGKGTVNLPTAGGAYLAKLNSSGALVWTRTVVEQVDSTYASASGLATDSVGNVYVATNFSGTVDFDPGPVQVLRTSVNGSTDFVVSKIAANGSLYWAETFGNDKADFVRSVSVDSFGKAHIVGYYTGAVDFNPDPLAVHYLSSAPKNRGFWFELFSTN